jgi:hypothetical protein
MRSRTLLALVLAIAGCAANPASIVEVVEEEDGFPDLTVHAFIPPIIMAGSGATIYLSDFVANVGEARSAESTIRYYISDEPEIDVGTAIVIGERPLRSLGPKEEDQSMELPFVIPGGLGIPPLYLAACIDVDDTLVEINESNNCTTNNSDNNPMIMSPMFMPGVIFDGAGVMPDPDQSPR